MNSQEEAAYRLKLTQGHLERQDLTGFTRWANLSGLAPRWRVICFTRARRRVQGQNGPWVLALLRGGGSVIDIPQSI